MGFKEVVVFFAIKTHSSNFVAQEYYNPSSYMIKVNKDIGRLVCREVYI